MSVTRSTGGQDFVSDYRVEERRPVQEQAGDIADSVQLTISSHKPQEVIGLELRLDL